MPPPKFVVLAKRVREDLDAHFVEKPRQLSDALEDLLALVLTAEIPGKLEDLAADREVRGLKTHLDQLTEFMKEQSNIPEAFCARYEYNQSERKVRRDWRITQTEWDYVHDLAREVMPIEDFYLRNDFSPYAWHDRIEKDIVNLDIVFDTRALKDLLLPVIEAYMSPKKGKRKGYEVYGICLGMWSERPNQQKVKGLTVTQYVHIIRCQPQLSADSTKHWVEWNERSVEALIEAARTLFPWYQIVGDFHSHLYDSLTELMEVGWHFSPLDERDIAAWFQHMKSLQQRPVVSFVAAVARSNRPVARAHYKGHEHTLQMSVGSCRIVIHAYRILGSGKHSDENIRLRAAGID